MKSTMICSCLSVLVLLSCIPFFIGCVETGNAQQQGHFDAEPARIGFYTAREQAVPLASRMPGRTIASNVAEVRPQVNGIILKRKFEEGAIVEEGQELYEIDASIYKAHYDKAAAHLKSMQRTMDRSEQLRESRTISEQEFEDVLFAWEQAKADLELARLNLEYCKVEAPLTGKIGRSMITMGALVTNGQPQELATIQQIDPIYVDLKPAVPQMLRMQNSREENESRLPFWQGAEVTLTLEDGSVYPLSGKINFIDNHVEQDTGTVTLRAEIPNPNGALLPGMFVRASVAEGVRNNGKLVPQQALMRDMKGRPYVWVIRQDDTVEMRFVETTMSLGNTWLIDSGLEGGDRIVVEGVQFVAHDAKVVPYEVETVELRLTYAEKNSRK